MCHDRRVLPYVDSHRTTVDAPAEAAYDAARARLTHELRGLTGAYARLVGVEGDRLFDVEREDRPRVLVLRGRHRFSTYRITVVVLPLGEERSALSATTHAEFPGVLGRAYRLAVITSGAHAVVTKGLLRDIARRAEAG